MLIEDTEVRQPLLTLGEARAVVELLQILSISDITVSPSRVASRQKDGAWARRQAGRWGAQSIDEIWPARLPTQRAACRAGRQTEAVANYDGPAVVLADGVTYPCHATLQGRTPRGRFHAFGATSSARGIEDWGGVLNVEGEAAAWSVQDADDRRLRIGDREGAFNVVGGSLAFGELRIRGSGRAPFGAS
ncbi:hypothetical protein [Streptomyces sp. KR80]|uniref:hypothetical protein n=1 Tax=Streptomyces sp. KR80 TaxID=3457426 RepID=UPI003FD25F12